MHKQYFIAIEGSLEVFNYSTRHEMPSACAYPYPLWHSCPANFTFLNMRIYIS